MNDPLCRSSFTITIIWGTSPFVTVCCKAFKYNYEESGHRISVWLWMDDGCGVVTF